MTYEQAAELLLKGFNTSCPHFEYQTHQNEAQYCTKGPSNNKFIDRHIVFHCQNCPLERKSKI